MSSRELAEDFGLPADSGGMIIGGVVEESPAAKAGLRVGDVILGFRGVTLKPMNRAQGIFLEQAAQVVTADKVGMVVWRDGEKLEVTLTAASPPKAAAQAERVMLSEIGMGVREIVLDDRFNLRLPKGEAGVVCESVAQATPASDAGLMPGDVLKKLNDEEIRDLSAFRKAFRALVKKQPEEVYFTVLRGGRDTLLCRMRPRWSGPPADPAAGN